MIQVVNNIDMKNAGCGIYMIEFSDGRFYIGCSRYIKERVLGHITCFKFDFRRSNPSLKKMKGFCGLATFSIIENVTYTDRCELLKKEASYINKYANNPLLLNKRNSLLMKSPKVFSSVLYPVV